MGSELVPGACRGPAHRNACRVALPEGTSALKLEDPRLPMMMAAPGRKKDAPRELRQFVYAEPVVGDVLLWESWLRHEVPMNMSEDDRISVSFNYAWG